LPNMGKQGKWIPGIHFSAIKHALNNEYNWIFSPDNT